jgi:hypothetical protein
MRLMQRINAVYHDRRFPFSLLVLATGLVLTLQNPQARDSAAELLSRVDVSSLTQALEMQPRTPPPGVEGDQLTVEEGEQLDAVVVPEREFIRTTDLRSGRER